MVLRAAALAIVAAGWLASAYFLWRTKVPGDLDLPELDVRDYFSATEVARADDYERFGRVNYLLSELVLLSALALYAWRGARFARESAAGRVGTGMLLGMLGLAIVWLVQVPFGLAQHWWERRHDVSELGYLEWATIEYFGLGAAFLFICLALLIVMTFAGILGDRWWIPGAAVFVALGMIFAFVSPYLIPDQRRLDDAALAADARRLAAAEGVPDVGVRVEDVDEYTEAPNAVAVGLEDTRRVVLWNTLLEEPFDRDEVRLVLAHEFAHHAREHLWKGVGWYALFAVPGAFLIAVVTRRRGGMREPAAVPLSLLVLVVLELVSAPIDNVISRRMEAEADWIALETTRDPAAARGLYRDFTETALADPDPPTWSYVLLDTHPSLLERIAMAEAWEDRRR